MPTKPDVSRQKELSIRQANAIDLLLTGKTDSEVAQAVGVTRQTVNGWRNCNAEFIAELSTRRVALWEAQDDRIRDLVPQAVDLMGAKIRDGDLTAAVQLLRAAGYYSGDRRPRGPNEETEMRKKLQQDLFPKILEAMQRAGLSADNISAVATSLEKEASAEVRH